MVDDVFKHFRMQITYELSVKKKEQWSLVMVIQDVAYY